MSPSVKTVYDTFATDVAYIIAPNVLPANQRIVGFRIHCSKDFDSLSTFKWNTSNSKIGYLSLNNLDKDTLTNGIHIIERLFSNITHLSLTSCGNAWEILSKIGRSNKLEWLSISASQDSYSCRHADTIWPKWELPTEHVDLRHVKTLKIIDLGATQLGEFVKFVLPGLTAVRHIHNIGFSNALAAGLVEHCHNIEILHFNQPALTDEGMSNILRLPKLKYLKFYCLNQSAWTGAIAPHVCNTTLERLELDSMCSVKSIMPTALACPNLKEFSGNYLQLPEHEPAMFMKALPKLTKFVRDHKDVIK